MKKKNGVKIELPRVAPEYWPGKYKTSESVPHFFERVWFQYLPHGLTMSYLEKMDTKLVKAIYNHPALSGKPWPKRLRVPNQRSLLAAKFERYKRGKASDLSPKELFAVARKMLRERQGSPRP